MTNVVQMSELVWKCLDCGLYRRENEVGEHTCAASTPEMVTITMPAGAALDLWYCVNSEIDLDASRLDLDEDEDLVDGGEAGWFKDWDDQVTLVSLRELRKVAAALTDAGVLKEWMGEEVAS